VKRQGGNRPQKRKVTRRVGGVFAVNRRHRRDTKGKEPGGGKAECLESEKCGQLTRGNTEKLVQTTVGSSRIQGASSSREDLRDVVWGKTFLFWDSEGA